MTQPRLGGLCGRGRIVTTFFGRGVAKPCSSAAVVFMRWMQRHLRLVAVAAIVFVSYTLRVGWLHYAPALWSCYVPLRQLDYALYALVRQFWFFFFMRWMQRHLWLMAVADIGVLYASSRSAALCAGIVVGLCATEAYELDYALYALVRQLFSCAGCSCICGCGGG